MPSVLLQLVIISRYIARLGQFGVRNTIMVCYPRITLSNDALFACLGDPMGQTRLDPFVLSSMDATVQLTAHFSSLMTFSDR